MQCIVEFNISPRIANIPSIKQWAHASKNSFMQQFNCFFVNNDRMQVNRPLCNNLIAPPRCMFCSFIEWSRTCKKPRDRCTQCPCAFYFSFQTKLDPISRKMRCTLFFLCKDKCTQNGNAYTLFIKFIAPYLANNLERNSWKYSRNSWK